MDESCKDISEMDVDFSMSMSSNLKAKGSRGLAFATQAALAKGAQELIWHPLGTSSSMPSSSRPHLARVRTGEKIPGKRVAYISTDKLKKV